MRYYLIFLATLFVCNTGMAQENTTANKVELKKLILLKEGVQNFIYYQQDCIGYKKRHYADSCFIDKIRYLVWSLKGRSFIQRFDECKEYEPRKMKVNLVAFIWNNYEKLRHEKNIYPQHEDTVAGKKRMLTTYVDHSCHHMFYWDFGKEKTHLDIDEFALLTEYLDDGKYFNINYRRNQKSLSKKLYDIITTETYK